MIRELRLKNFQKHKTRRIQFGPGINLIVGPTDGGKSAVFRALKWLALHGAGTQYTTHGETEMRVGVLHYDDQNQLYPITRFRNTKENGYQCGDRKFVAVGNNQPEIVSQVLGLSEINFQAQHDPPFLLGMSPGQVAREINKIVDLSKIDIIQARIKSASTLVRTNLLAEEPKVAAAKTALEALEWVPDARKAWDAVTGLETELIALEGRSERLRGLLEPLPAMAAAIAEGEALAEATESCITYATTLYSQAHLAKTRETALGTLLGELREISHVDEMDACIASLEALVSLQADYKATNTRFTGLQFLWTNASLDCAAVKGMMECGKAGAEVLRLKADIDARATLSRMLQLVIGAIKNLGIEIKTTETEIKEMEGKVGLCPTCGKPL